jgi:hypothetical protein
MVIDRAAQTLTLVEMRTDRPVATVSARPPAPAAVFQGERRAFTEDSGRFLTVHHDELVVYRLPGLTVEHRLPLPVLPGLGGPPADDGDADDWAGSVVPVGADQAVVFSAGMLTRWDLRTGTRVAEPLPLREGESPGARRRMALQAFAADVRPGHPDQVAVVLPDGTVQVWGVGERRKVGSFAWDAVTSATSARFLPDGGHMVVKQENGSMAVRSLADPGRPVRDIPVGPGAVPLGFAPGAATHLITADPVEATSAQIWNARTGQRVAVVTAPFGSTFSVQRDELRISADGYERVLRLDPGLWMRSLCALGGRAYTPEELELLRDRHAPVGRPCP